MLKRNKAFTLAEVLITLGIIGIVAAMTIPTIMKVSDDLRSISTFKQTYAILSAATLKIKEENGSDLIGAFGASGQSMSDAYTDKLLVIRNCRDYELECWASTERLLSGAITTDFGNVAGGGMTHVVLKNGVFVAFRNLDAACVTKCGQIYIDTNGFKLPNQIGYDMFIVFVKADGLSSVSSYPCSKSDPGGRSGFGCASYVLQGKPYDP